MDDAHIPIKFTIVFARDAAVGDVTDPFPVTAQTGGLASFPTGFGEINFTPLSAGGVPPWGKDANGILRVVTQWLQWYQAGAPVAYDAAFSTAVGGYPAGSIVASATQPGLAWVSTTDNNVTNPDTGGAGWEPVVQRASSGRANAGIATCYTSTANPNGLVAGTAGTAIAPPDLCWDRTNGLLYACSVTGNAATAQWVAVTFTPSTYAAHTVILGSGAPTFGVSNLGLVGQPLIAGVTVNPAFAALDLQNGNATTGLLPVVRGGTGVDHVPLGSVVTGNDTSAFDYVAPVGFNGAPLVSRANAKPAYDIVTNQYQQHGAATFSASQVWPVPAGVGTIKARLWGPGGGGGGCVSSSVGYGGGGGGYVEALLSVSPTENLVITIGAAGSGGVGASPGTAGANSRLQGVGFDLQAGGGGGGGVFSGGTYGAGGTASGGNLLNVPGQEGGTFWQQGGSLNGLYIAAGGGGTHGTTRTGPGGGGGGGNGIFPGGGGGGAAGTSLLGFNGGNGAASVLILEW